MWGGIHHSRDRFGRGCVRSEEERKGQDRRTGVGAAERSVGNPSVLSRLGAGDLEFPACTAAAGRDGNRSWRKRFPFCGFWALSVVVVGSEVHYIRPDGVGASHAYLQPQEL